MRSPRLTKPDRLLLAARQLTDVRRTFTEAQLTEAAWKEWNDAFGLRGMEKRYPCSNTVRACLVGVKGLIQRGYLIKRGPLAYSLSGPGQREADRLALGEDSSGRLSPIRVPKSLGDALDTIRRSVVWHRHRDGMTGQVNAGDARAFLALQPCEVCDKVAEYLVDDAATLYTGEEIIGSLLAEIRQACQWVRGAFPRVGVA